MIGDKQETLLVALRGQLQTLSKAGVLSQQQMIELKKLNDLHDLSERVSSRIVPNLDKTFEATAPVAYPYPVTDENAKLATLSDCRREVGLHPDSANDSGFLPGASFRIGVSHDSVAVMSEDLSGWDLASVTFGQDSPGKLPSLFTILSPPTDSDDIIEYIQKNQSEKCVQCNKKIERTTLGLGPYKARWCHEANAFCCYNCNNGTCRCILPSYAILRWDFEPKVCRQAYGSDAELTYQKPTLCPGAENPQLFDQVPLLQDMRRLRLQLSKLYDIGNSCPAFASALEEEPDRPSLGGATAAAAAGGSAASILGGAPKRGQATFFVAERQRYLVHESEMWSLADLETVFTSAPKRFVPPGTNIPFAAFLQGVRDAMIRHVLTECDKCKLTAAHICLGCGTEPHIYSFDVRNCYECSRCRAVFHKRCWEVIVSGEQGCPGCAEEEVRKRAELDKRR